MIPQFIKPYLGRVALTLLGLAAGILMLTIGFWKTMVLLAMAALGYLVGCLADGKIDIARLLARIRH